MDLNPQPHWLRRYAALYVALWRNSVVREMERRRDMMARVQEVIADAEFEDVTSAVLEHADAA